jgi:hypothetical protein
MPKFSVSADPSSIALQDTIDLLRKQEHKWRKTGGNRALHRYLNSVFGQYASWMRAGVHQNAIERIAKLADLPDRDRRHPIRTIIDAISVANARSTLRPIDPTTDPAPLNVNHRKGRYRTEEFPAPSAWRLLDGGHSSAMAFGQGATGVSPGVLHGRWPLRLISAGGPARPTHSRRSLSREYLRGTRLE